MKGLCAIAKQVFALAGLAGVVLARAWALPESQQAVPAADVCMAAEQAWAAWASMSFVGARAQAACAAVRSLPVPSGRLSLQMRDLPQGQSLTRRMQVWMDVSVDERFVRSVPVALLVEWKRSAWVARHDLVTGQALEPGMFEIKEVDALAGHGLPAESPAWGQGVRLRRSLPAGRVLTTAHVEAQPAVARGGSVQLKAHSGGISLLTPAEALQDGAPGQRVLVRAKHAAGPVMAWVVGPNLVELKP